MSPDPSPIYSWEVNCVAWSDTARRLAHLEIPRRLPRALRGRAADPALLNSAIERAISEACIPQKRSVPWLFSSEDQFVRWIVVSAARLLLSITPPRRVIIPMMVEMEQPHCSIYAYFRCDSFRVADLCYVFEPLTESDIVRILQEAENRWQRFFGQ